jgi:hypothetical protein
MYWQYWLEVAFIKMNLYYSTFKLIFSLILLSVGEVKRGIASADIVAV